jgi:glycosyltransferase involved in cell wall biosynthesis
MRPNAGVVLTINGRFLSQRATGVQRYAFEMLQALDALLSEMLNAERPVVATLLVPPNAAEPLPNLRHIEVRRVGRLSGHLWEQIELPCYARGILVNWCNTFPIARLGSQIVQLHDASVYACPDGYTFGFRTFYRMLFAIAAARRSIKIATDSEFSAAELQRFVGIRRLQVTVVPCGVDHCLRVEPDYSVIDRFGLRQERFVMAVGSDNKNKNIARLIEAFSQLRAPGTRLVLVGGGNSQIFSGVEFAKADWLIRTGYLSDDEVAALYSAASVFVFPSLYEGFGLPPLEAMSFGCPVICSNRASLPEVAGDAALYCDPVQVDDIRRQLDQLLNSPELRERLIDRGKQHSLSFTWRAAAQKMLRLILN